MSRGVRKGKWEAAVVTIAWFAAGVFVGMYLHNRLHWPLLETRQRMLVIDYALTFYRAEYGRLPDVDRSELIVKVLLGHNVQGQNPEERVYLDVSHIDEWDEFGLPLDGWGTPFELRGTDCRGYGPQIHVVSFGPNQTRDGDDLVSIVEGPAG